MSKKITPFLALIILAMATAMAHANVDLQPWLQSDENLWQRSADSLSRSILIPGKFRYGNPLRSTNCRLGDLPVEEALIGLTDDGRISSVRLSIVNRGDTEGLSLEQLETVKNKAIGRITAWTGTPGGPEENQRIRHAVHTRKVWTAADRAIILSWSVSRRQTRSSGQVLEPRAEFVRIDVVPVESVSDLAAPPLPPSVVRRQEALARDTQRANLPDRVIRQPNGDVLIRDVPMVDQGDKGYCAVATISRMMQYYGLDVDQHKIAQLANASPTAGTQPGEMMEVLRRAGSRLGITSRTHYYMDYAEYSRLVESYNRAARRARMPLLPNASWVSMSDIFEEMNADVLREVRIAQRNDYQRFLTTIRSSIDVGVPMAWSMILGIVPEEGTTPQHEGGHMRLIIGYNNQTKELIFSDSWGRGHEEKRIRMEHAWAVTTGLYVIEPRREG